MSRRHHQMIAHYGADPVQGPIPGGIVHGPTHPPHAPGGPGGITHGNSPGGITHGPPGSALAGDPTLLAAQDQGRRQMGLADATALYQNNQIGATYGFDQSGGIDANNPYSRAALLQESYRRARLGNTNSYAAQGQLYSGAAQNAQDESTRNYNIGFDQLQKGYQSDRDQALLTQIAAYAGAAGDVSGAGFQALLDKLKGSS